MTGRATGRGAKGQALPDRVPLDRIVLDRGEIGPVTQAACENPPRTVTEALDLAVAVAPLRPFVGQGATLDVWEALASLGARDLALARAVEPHLDALTILDQAGFTHVRGGTWGVFAAEGPGTRLVATETESGWQLDGVKPWCSLAGSLSDALVTAWVGETERRLFWVSLGQAGVRVSSGTWEALGLREIPSGSVAFDGVPARPIGETGWYLDRPGFSWGGMSVAACWFGGAVGVARPLLAAARDAARSDDAILLMHLGRVDARLAEARTALATAAHLVDGGYASAAEGNLLAKRVRATVARAAEDVLRHVGHALGPAPLAEDADHAKRVADLEIYVRQHHGERDDVSLGRSVRDGDLAW